MSLRLHVDVGDHLRTSRFSMPSEEEARQLEQSTDGQPTDYYLPRHTDIDVGETLRQRRPTRAAKLLTLQPQMRCNISRLQTVFLNHSDW